MPQPFSELLERHRGTIWSPFAPVPEEAIKAMESTLGCRFPDEYRETLRAGDRPSFYGRESRVLLFELRHLPQFNPAPDAAPNLAPMLLFADDEGDNFFFFDSKNELGHGEWAVFAVEMGSMNADDAVFIAKDFRQLIERVIAGEELF